MNISLKYGKNRAYKYRERRDFMKKDSICAVILAGGMGTRLSPLTDDTPKPLMKILNKTVLSLAVEKAKSIGIEKIFVSVCYKWEQIAEQMKKYPNVEIIREATPIGTAGGAKMCAGTDYENVLVLSGDGIFDFDIKKVYEFHRSTGSDVTIVSTRCANPTSFGEIICEPNGSVIEIIEKPSWKNVITNVVNTGIYILSKRAMAEIPDGIAYDFSNELFPKLLRSGFNVNTITLDGYWCDIGTPKEYLKCCINVCLGKIRGIENEKNEMQSLLSVGIGAKAGVYLEEGTVFGGNVILENGFVAGKNCIIENNCTISESVFGDGVKIGCGSGIYSAIIGDHATIGENCIIAEGCVIQSGAKIENGTVLDKGTCVRRSGKKSGGFNVRKKALFIEDSTVFFSEKEQVYTEKLIYCLCKNLDENDSVGRCSVGIIEKNHDKNTCSSVIDGCKKAGCLPILLCDAEEKHFEFAGIFYPFDITVSVSDTGSGTLLRFIAAGGKRISPTLERKTTKSFYSADEKILSSEQLESNANALFISGTDILYRQYLEKSMKRMLHGVPLILPRLKFSADKSRFSALSDIVDGLPKGKTKFLTDITVIPSETGFINIRIGEKIYDYSHISAAILKNTDILGIKKIYLDDECPNVYLQILNSTGTDFEFISDSNLFGEEDRTGLLILRDPVFTLATLLCLFSLAGKNAVAVLEEIPGFEIFTDIFTPVCDRAASMDRLFGLYGLGDRKTGGITVKLSEGNVTVIPERVSGIKIMSEAASMETAKELCHKIADVIEGKNYMQ